MGNIRLGLVLALLSVAAIAQTFRADIAGAGADASGTAIVGASVFNSSFGELSHIKHASSAPGFGFGEPRNVQPALKIISNLRKPAYRGCADRCNRTRM